MIILTAPQASNIKCIYNIHHECQPVEIEKGVFVIHDDIFKIPEIRRKLKKPSTKITIGHKSTSDIKFRSYITKSSKINITKL